MDAGLTWRRWTSSAAVGRAAEASGDLRVGEAVGQPQRDLLAFLLGESAARQKFTTPAPIAAVLGIQAGRMQVIAADRADTTVEVRPADPSKSRDVKLAGQTTVEHTDGTLRITATAETRNRIPGPSGSVEVTVQLPAGSRIDAKSDGAEFRGVGRLGDVAIDGAHGQVKLDETAGARLTVLAGDVSVGRLGGPAESPYPWTPALPTAGSTTRSGTPTAPAPT